ncbi:FAD-dependent monooxygenase [Herbiconiux sp. CPCC 203407]|uniref:FAD-dependent monooxygenase n=1 Tax=Herbiconiux oxytropis TaxID=2970915 RepID=A0AA41XHE2_9MICO|nr:FAD-dependent monooxygenase [Herbiconiux oxytropis]MCS5722568.1 FAD-dependent monooxygenase [Herbiconiux oxytropis]MCS5726508.1 FAD-dependent monooxygenase [Herbiconiux oxytropis]
MTTLRDQRVTIVGGGMGGLASALVLRRQGAQVTLFEHAPAFGEVGAGIQLGPNATRILGEWGLLDEVIARGYRPENLVLKDAITGEVLTKQSLGREFVERYGAPYVVIHRSDLHAILLEAAEREGVELLVDSHVQGIDDDGDGVVVTLADGRTHRSDAVLAADGLASLTRDRIVGDAPVASGYVAYRGTLPETRGHGNDVVAWLGPRCHFVQYPIRRGEMLNMVAVFQSPAFLRGETEWGGVDELDAAYEACSPEVKEAVQHLWRDRRWPMFDREPATTWGDGRVTLIGDSAHPMLQYLAQGACQALEDAHSLDVLAARTPGDWPATFGALADLRQPRTARVQRTARVWGEIWHVDGVARVLRNELLEQRDVEDYRYLDWLYGRGVGEPAAQDAEDRRALLTEEAAR